MYISIYIVDENVVVGSTPASADKKSITDFGSLESIGNKLAAKRYTHHDTRILYHTLYTSFNPLLLPLYSTYICQYSGGKLIASSARETDGIVFYQFEFENPLDPNLPRTGPKDKRYEGVAIMLTCRYYVILPVYV